MSYIFFNQSTGPWAVEESDWTHTWIQYKHGVILPLEQMKAFVSLKSLIVTIQKKVVNKHQDVIDSWVEGCIMCPVIRDFVLNMFVHKNWEKNDLIYLATTDVQDR